MKSELVKALEQRIDELGRENKFLSDKYINATAEIEELNERILDLEACR